MSLRAGERELISAANMHVPGRQLDPEQVARDLIRLREWRARRVSGGPRERSSSGRAQLRSSMGPDRRRGAAPT
jgi:hypothetical protein